MTAHIRLNLSILIAPPIARSLASIGRHSEDLVSHERVKAALTLPLNTVASPAA
jgi:hypothetical protein